MKKPLPNEMVCLRCDKVRMFTRKDKVSFIQIVHGERVRVESEGMECPKCGYQAVGRDQLDALLKATKIAFGNRRHSETNKGLKSMRPRQVASVYRSDKGEFNAILNEIGFPKHLVKVARKILVIEFFFSDDGLEFKNRVGVEYRLIGMRDEYLCSIREQGL